MLGRKKKKESKKAPELDLNGDGKFDAKDKSIAAKALRKDLKEGAKELEENKAEPSKPKDGHIAIRDISLKYRKGDCVPANVVAEWKRMGIFTNLLVEE